MMLGPSSDGYFTDGNGLSDDDSIARPFVGRIAPNPSSYMTAKDGNRPSLELDDETVRSFMITGGRSMSASGALDFETMLEATTKLSSVRSTLRFEPAKIADLCWREVLSVAEVAARLDLPIGVVQVLANDLVDQGVLVAHEPESSFSDEVLLIERLIDGLCSL
jgi:hypothetical protein